MSGNVTPSETNAIVCDFMISHFIAVVKVYSVPAANRFYIFPFTMVSAMRCFFSSTLTTQTFTTSPTFSTSDG